MTQWIKNSLWRQAKFLTSKQQIEQITKLFDEMKYSKEQRDEKYFGAVYLFNKQMNARRSYATKKVKQYLIGTFYINLEINQKKIPVLLIDYI